MLSLLDRVAATALLDHETAEAEEVEELTRAAAAALADEDVCEARASRRRMLARLMAIEKTTSNLLVGMLGESLRGGLPNERSVRVARLLDRLANSSCRRLTMLIRAAEPCATAIAIENALVSVEAAE